MYILKKTVNNTTGDNMIYFLIVLITVVVAVFFVPIKVVIYSNLKGKNVYYVDNLEEKGATNIVIKLLRLHTCV